MAADGRTAPPRPGTPASAARRGEDLSPDDPLAAADGLEPPELHARLLAWIAVGAIIFVIASMTLLYGLYRLLLANPQNEPPHSFPEPRLETNINPRNMPSTPEPGAAPYVLRKPPVEPGADVQRAMQAVVAKGAHALDPLSAPPPPAGNVAR